MTNIILKEKMLKAGDIKSCELARKIREEYGENVSKYDMSKVLHGKLTTPRGERILKYAYSILDRMITERGSVNG